MTSRLIPRCVAGVGLCLVASGAVAQNLPVPVVAPGNTVAAAPIAAIATAVNQAGWDSVDGGLSVVRNGTVTITAGSLNLDPSTAKTGNVTKGNLRFLYDFLGGTFLGFLAGNFTMTGENNTAVGASVLSSNTTGFGNVGIGIQALLANTQGSGNIAIGTDALSKNILGHANTAIGSSALFYTEGSYNTAIGRTALWSNMTGSSNVAIGYQAGYFATGSNNIYISNLGDMEDSDTIRLGNGLSGRAFIGGIRGVTTGSQDAIEVMIDSSGQLGTISSSARYKEDIQNMGEASRGLMRLRPVTFRYTQAYADGAKPIDYGLIAEEVAEVYPGLVVYNEDGQPETVQYHKVNTMLLNEVQRLSRDNDRLGRDNETQQQQIDGLLARLARLESLATAAIAAGGR